MDLPYLCKMFAITKLGVLITTVLNKKGKKTGSHRQKVRELPGILVVAILPEGVDAISDRRPIGVMAFHGTEVRTLDLEASDVVHLVGFDESRVGVLQRPYHTSQHRRRDLHARGVLVGRESTGLVDR